MWLIIITAVHTLYHHSLNEQIIYPCYNSFFRINVHPDRTHISALLSLTAFEVHHTRLVTRSQCCFFWAIICIHGLEMLPVQRFVCYSAVDEFKTVCAVWSEMTLT